MIIKNKTKAIIFDWGGTLFNPETKNLFEGTFETVKGLSQNYVLVIVSLAASQPIEDRRKQIEENKIGEYFQKIYIDDKDKDWMYEKALEDFNLKPEGVWVVDDRVIRGIAWGNRRGIKTVWLRQGRFSNELPNEETGDPTLTIYSIVDLKNFFN